MAKDDYDVIAYRILVYFYGCLKRKIIFETTTFEETVRKYTESDAYFYDILRMMQAEGLIEGLTFVDAWGGDAILTSDLSEAKIAVAGIHYLKDDGKMREVGQMLKTEGDMIATLASLLSLN